MTEQTNDSNVKILENATPFEVEPGDYIIWEGATLTIRRTVTSKETAL